MAVKTLYNKRQYNFTEQKHNVLCEKKYRRNTMASKRNKMLLDSFQFTRERSLDNENKE